MRTAGKFFINQYIEENYKISSDLFTSVEGRKFHDWIENGSRSNGYSANDLIFCPPYIIESIIRDEILKEDGITIDEVVTNYDELRVFGLKNNTDDWYNGAILIDRNLKQFVNILDYDGAQNLLTTDSDVFTTHSAGNKIEVYNIQGDNKVNVNLFDYLGNTTDGLRKDWIFGASINKKVGTSALLNTLLFESHCLLTQTNGKYNIFAIEDDNTVATWTNPLKINGREGISSQLTPIENVFNNFTIKWKHDIGSNEYQRKLTINRNSASGYLTENNITGDYERNLCKWSYSHYKIDKPYEYGCAFIYDDETAERFINLLIKWLYKRRLIVSWRADFQNYIKYEIGDVVKLNYNRYIPSSMNGVSNFMIIGKTIITNSVPNIQFTLIETT